MADPSEGRSSSNEFFDKDKTLANAQADDKLVEHTRTGIASSSKSPDNAMSYSKEQEVQRKEEEENFGFSDINDDDEYEDESTVSGENVSQKARKRSRRTTPVKSIAFKLYYFLCQLREMFIRRFLRAFSHIFRNLGRYQRNKVLNEATYQQLSSRSNGVQKLKKMVSETKYETKKAKIKLQEYLDYDYKDPRNFIRDAHQVLDESRGVSIGTGINLELSSKDMIESVTQSSLLSTLQNKTKKEFDEEKEEIAEAKKLAEMHGLPDRERNYDERKNLKRKLSFVSKPIMERAETRRREGTSFRAINFKRALPSLKRRVSKADIKVKVKSTWASLTRRILYKAKPYSLRFRNRKMAAYDFSETMRTPTSKFSRALHHKNNGILS